MRWYKGGFDVDDDVKEEKEDDDMKKTERRLYGRHV